MILEEETETQQLVREMVERMIGNEIMDKNFNPAYIDPHRLQVDWEVEYDLEKQDRRLRNAEARRKLRFKERWGGNNT